ncbi:UNVERIFIED_CONTAM: hypothetical protein FKN15_005642 [Acipenser sinensis]
MSRNSAFGGFGGAEKIKDPRPLHDKSFVQQCIRQLCEYLGENGFPSPVTVKSLQSPTSKEFLKIFSFIYSFLDPTFQMPTSKIEEEIPRILKDLGYPFPISKSSMYSVGAPHTWPQILGGLIWLIDSVKLFDTMREQDLLFPDFSDGGIETEDGIEFNKLFISYTSKSYDRFMQGADTFEEEDAEFFPKLRLQIEALKQETGRLQHIFENQKFSQADIERINHERNELQQTITNLNKNLAEAEHHMWNEEIALAKSKEAVEAELAKYHTLARKLKLIPASAENACGHDFEIKFTIECGPSRIGHYKNQIHTPLMNMISQVEEEINKLVPQKLSMVETSEQVSSMIADKANDLKLLKEQLRKLDEQLEQELHEADREEHKWSTELDSLESHKKLLEKKVTDGYDEAVEQLKATRQEYHLVLQETSEERRIVANNLSSILDIVTNHVSFVEKEHMSTAFRSFIMNKLYQRHCPAEFLTHTHTHHHRGSVAEVLSSSSNRLLAAISASDIYEGYLVYEKWSTRRASAQYTRVGEQLRLVIPAPVQCSVACGGCLCKYENPIKWTEEEQAIKGLYSSWITENILAMARPSSEAIQQHAIIQQFKQ